MLLGSDNRADNSSSTSITEATNEGYTPCATSIFGFDLNGPDRINIFPNPAEENIYISNLKQENVVLKIYDMQGKLVLKQPAKNGYLNISFLSKGIYQIKFEGNICNETRKLIIE